MTALQQVFSRDPNEVTEVTRKYLSEIMRSAAIRDFYTNEYQSLLPYIFDDYDQSRHIHNDTNEIWNHYSGQCNNI